MVTPSPSNTDDPVVSDGPLAGVGVGVDPGERLAVDRDGTRSRAVPGGVHVDSHCLCRRLLPLDSEGVAVVVDGRRHHRIGVFVEVPALGVAVGERRFQGQRRRRPRLDGLGRLPAGDDAPGSDEKREVGEFDVDLDCPPPLVVSACLECPPLTGG